MDDIPRRIREMLAAHLGPAAASAAPDGARFIEELKATSLDLVELIMSIEDAFDIEIPDAASETMFTVGDLVTCVTEKVDAKRECGGTRPVASPPRPANRNN